MEFLSDLKKAYDTIGEEVSKSFDSSQTGEQDDAVGGEAVLEDTDNINKIAANSHSPHASLDGRASEDGGGWGGDGGEGWGDWGSTNTPQSPSGSRGIKLGVTTQLSSPATVTPLLYLEDNSRSTLSDSSDHVAPPDSVDQGPTETECRKEQALSPAKEPSLVPRLAVKRSPSPLATSTPTSSKQPSSSSSSQNKLDSLSRDDLVKYVKKQAQVVQRYKTRCDELAREREKSAGSSRSAPSQGLMEELQISRSERDDAISRERTLKQSLSSLELDKKNLGEQLRALELEHAETKQSLHQMPEHRDKTDGTEKEQLHSKIASLKDSLARSETTIKQNETALSELRATEETVRSEVEERASRAEEELQALREHSEAASRDAAQQLSGLRMENEELHSELATLREGANRAENSLQSQSDANEILKSEVTSLKSECAQLKQTTLQESRESEKSLKLEKEQLQVSHDQLQISHDNVQQSCDQLTDQVQALQSELRKALSSLDTIQQEKCALETSYLQQRSSILEETHCEMEQVRSDKIALESRIQELECSLETRNEDLESARGEISVLGLSSGEKESGLLSQLQELERKSQRVESELSISVNTVSALKTQLSGMESKIEEKDSQVASLQCGKQALEAELREHAEQQDRAIAELEANLLNSRTQLAALEDANQTIKCEADSLRTENDALKATSSESATVSAVQLTELQASCKELQGQCEEVRGECEGVKVERDTALKALDDQTSSHKEESKKLKAYIKKMKKENNDKEASLRQQLQGVGAEAADLGSRLEAAVAERDALRLQLEQAGATVLAEKQSMVDSESERVKELETQIETLRNAIEMKEAQYSSVAATLTSEGVTLRAELQSASEAQDLVQSELTAATSDLVTAHSQANTHRMAAEQLQAEVQSVKAELAREREVLADLQQKLAIAEKEAKVSTVMSLELEDYQRSVRALEGELASRGALLEDGRRESQRHHNTVLQLRREIELFGEQRSQSDDKASKMKQMIVKHKKELAEAKKKEAELQDNVARLLAELEVEKQGLEEAKVEIGQLAASVQSSQQQAESEGATLQRAVRALEHKLSQAQEELCSTQQSLELCQQEYESYKVRVHSVLKQKSTPNQTELNSEIRQKHETELLKLKAQLQDTKDRLASALSEHEELLVDHEQLAGRHEQLLQESRERTDQLHRQHKEEQARFNTQSREQTELVSQLRQEIADVTAAFKSQIHSLQVEQHKQVTGLREEVHLARAEVSRLLRETDSRVLARANSNHTNKEGGETAKQVTLPDTTSTLGISFSERKSSGEGMDHSELESFSSLPATPLSREDSQVSLERLLSSVEQEGVSMATEEGVQATASELRYRKQLKAASRKIQHLTEVLHESEESTVRFSDQAKLLKEEIRRLERNQQREQGVSSMEYLKNVVLKFIHTQGQEQSSLVPIITKLLNLSPQEVKFLEQTVKGNPAKLPGAGEEVSSPTASKGWNSYIHRWTGY